MTTLLCGVFFLSGFAALVFEALWFCLAGLTFGNSVWASAIVLATFMAGLALGNGWVAVRGHRCADPIRGYALLEGMVGISGFTIVALLPHLTNVLTPVFRSLEGNLLLVNCVRLGGAALLMLLPAAAMGATLPLLVRFLVGQGRDFGCSLGVLYGWNTLGATAGVLAAEVLLIPWFGIQGTGLVAVCLSLVAAACAWRLSGAGTIAPEASPPTVAPRRLSSRALRLLAAGFLCGLILLALEVVWFRFLALFFSTISRNFATMLAMVLAGIGCGGVIASRWTSARSAYPAWLTGGMFAAGAAVALLYGNIGAVLGLAPWAPHGVWLLLAAGVLMFPVSLLSGAIFVLLGRALHDEIGISSRAAGLLGLSNAVGGTIGSLLAGFVLIPHLGLEVSFFVLALLYGVGALLVWPGKTPATSPSALRWTWAAAAVFAAATVFFPFGSMISRYLQRTVAPFESRNGERRVAYREGISETVQYLERRLLGQPYSYRLLTDSNSMSASDLASRRYMKYFVYLPVALHPRPESALLICFGLGSTAEALADTPDLQRIDIVDVSPDVVAMSSIVFPDPDRNPARNPRVRVHIEDGRFFLQTTERRFDIITAEPPPPRNSGIVNLYTREYFQLIRNRLTDAGFVSYWLPVAEMTRVETQAILSAFCSVFPECSVWSGSGFEWVMLGTKGTALPATEEAFRRQWTGPGTSPTLRALGFPSPEEFGALFIADGPRLHTWLEARPPLTDDRPRRLSDAFGDPAPALPSYEKLMDPEDSRENFLSSPTIARLWPEKFRREAGRYFPARPAINQLLDRRVSRGDSWPERVRRSLSDPVLRPYRLWALDSDQFAQDIVSRTPLEILADATDRAVALKHLAAGAVANGDYPAAQKHYRRLIDMLAANLGGDDALKGELLERNALYLRVLAELSADRRSEDRHP